MARSLGCPYVPLGRDVMAFVEGGRSTRGPGAARIAGARMVVDWPRGVPCGSVSGGDVFFIHQYPHGALFPRMAAVVHHGGAGTTATAAAGGVPQIIVPHILDQYFGAERVYRAGIGPGLLRRSRLTIRKLARSIDACLSSSRIKQTVLAVRDDILERDGVGMTVEALLGGD